MSADRRQHPRLSLSVDVDLTSGSNFYAGRTRDLSVGGLFIETPVGIDPGTELGVRLELGGKAFQVSCVVVWSLENAGRTAGIGVEFRDLPPVTRNAILRFMKERDPVAFGELDVTDDEEEAAPAVPPPLPHPAPPPLPGAGKKPT